ncbi:uncharacterized protein GGS22DRAFT_154956 [Annulohypoxylon maeteangense]|uniref:uncharacterized protein n=1 Tax=Annulohypoxylon maeteangense TaxID=1927788 RepID=UPI0020082956|nr:uncharacterized protein GGS22DRAFT_154956 [Annulohypoxylon maeteangense]KAI0888042.1 hypothetical protein GGS22DRAFT_154956 [Annulohypoxylon maeteangense]
MRLARWPIRAKMNVFSYIRKDARLLNATVYAQWLCVLSAISCIVIRICWLISAETPAPDNRLEWVGIAIMVADMIFFPTASVTIELSHLLRSRWLALLGIFYCTLRLFTGFIFTATVTAEGPSGPFLFLGMARVVATYYGLILPYVPNKTPFESEARPVSNMESVPVRACFYLAYSLTLPYATRVPPFAERLFRHATPHLYQVDFLARYALPSLFEPATVFALLASLAYWMALFFRQEYVFSRTLGGPGVERLTFIRPGRVQTVDSIGLEEGRIRLP